MAIDADLKTLANEKNFAVVSTILPGGQPQSQVIWVEADDEHVLLNTEVHRQKFKNVERDPRITVTIMDAANPYRFIEVRGRVTGTVGGQAARDDIDGLSQKYHGRPYANPITSERVVLQITPDKLYKHNI